MPPPPQQAQAEQEEEFISNTLLKKIHSLKKEKETLAMNYEQEEEFLTNDLSRKLAQVTMVTALSLSNITTIYTSRVLCHSYALFVASTGKSSVGEDIGTRARAADLKAH